MAALNEKEAQIRVLRVLLGNMCPKCITERGIGEINNLIASIQKEIEAMTGKTLDETVSTVKVAKLKPKKKRNG